MKKQILTQLTPDAVCISLDCPELNDSDRALCKWSFPVSMVNPRVALQIATLLVSDPTIPQYESKEE